MANFLCISLHSAIMLSVDIGTSLLVSKTSCGLKLLQKLMMIQTDLLPLMSIVIILEFLPSKSHHLNSGLC